MQFCKMSRGNYFPRPLFGRPQVARSCLFSTSRIQSRARHILARLFLASEKTAPQLVRGGLFYRAYVQEYSLMIPSISSRVALLTSPRKVCLSTEAATAKLTASACAIPAKRA